MITRLPHDPLNSRARHALITAKYNTSSWFGKIRNLCLQYNLPHPLSLLDFPPSKTKYKSLIKSKITDFWELRLRQEAAPLTSLMYFKPGYVSLARPHPIWWTAGANPYEVAKAVVQCRMLSGRYRTKQLMSNWSVDGDSCCPSSSCTGTDESLEHILLECPAYVTIRTNLVEKFKSVKNENLRELAMSALDKPPTFLMQFLLDATALSSTHSLIAKMGEEILFPLFNLTRTWCYAIHKERLIILKRKMNK